MDELSPLISMFHHTMNFLRGGKKNYEYWINLVIYTFLLGL